MNRSRWSRILLFVGVAAMLLGALDPLEGIVLIFPGALAIAASAMLARRYRAVAIASVVLIALGIGGMLLATRVGGIQADTPNRSLMVLAILPYPVGWLVGIIGGALMFRRPHPSAP
jgi:hypothetical protein